MRHTTHLFGQAKREAKRREVGRVSKQQSNTKKRVVASKPAWDNSIHDLSIYKLSPKQMNEKKKLMQSKNLDIARQELDKVYSPPPPKKKKELPPRPKSAPPRSVRIKTVSPIITKVGDTEPETCIDLDFPSTMSLDEEQFIQEGLHFERQHALELNSVVSADEKSIILAKPATDFDNASFSCDAWSDTIEDLNEYSKVSASNLELHDREHEEQLDQHMEQLDEEHSLITNKMKLLEYEAQIEQGRGQILILEDRKKELVEKVQKLEEDLATSRSETENVRLQFEQYKIENERIQAELRAKVKRLTDDLEQKDPPPTLSSRIFQVEQKYASQDEDCYSDHSSRDAIGRTTSNFQDNYQQRGELLSPYLVSASNVPSPIQTIPQNVSSPSTPTLRTLDDRRQYSPRDLSPYITYFNKAPHPHPHPRHPKGDNLAAVIREPASSFHYSDQKQMIFHERFNSNLSHSDNYTPPQSPLNKCPHSADSALQKQQSRVKSFILRSATPSPPKPKSMLTNQLDQLKRKGLTQGVRMPSGYNKNVLSIKQYLINSPSP